MLLGKRQRPQINRTTSRSEMKLDLNLPSEPEPSDQRLLSMVSPKGTLRRHSADNSTHAGDFLSYCFLCKRNLVPGRDIYMYRGDTAFCSLECRQQQITEDEKSVVGSTVAAGSS